MPGTNDLEFRRPAPPHLPVRRAPRVRRVVAGDHQARAGVADRPERGEVLLPARVVRGQRALREPGGSGPGVSPGDRHQAVVRLDQEGDVAVGVAGREDPAHAREHLARRPGEGADGRAVAPRRARRGRAASPARPRGRAARRRRAGGAPRRGPSAGGWRGPCPTSSGDSAARRERGRQHVPLGLVAGVDDDGLRARAAGPCWARRSSRGPRPGAPGRRRRSPKVLEPRSSTNSPPGQGDDDPVRGDQHLRAPRHP